MKYDFFYPFRSGLYDEKTSFPCYKTPNNEVQVTLIGDDEYDRIDLTGNISHDGLDYIITSVIIQCNIRHLLLPDSVESININRPSKNYYFDADSSQIYLQNNQSPFLWCKTGSLFSKDMKTLYHLHRDNNEMQIELEEHIQVLSPGCICLKNHVRQLVVPIGVTELKANSITANRIDEIVFRGAISSIEKGALDNIYNQSGDCTIRINAPLSNINDEGKEELRKWYHANPYTRKVVFAAPVPRPFGSLLKNGFIELSKVISMNEKISTGLDSQPICINADINEGIIRDINDEETDISNAPIIINKVSTSENETYDIIDDITEMRFATNREIVIRVYESYETVKALIIQSYKGK